jgi:O-antigen/teichoic acid export membrane protein
MRKQKALYNLLANLVLQLVTAASGFILPALFILHYGSEINGMIGSIKQFMAYLSLVEAGVGTASIAALYAPLVNRNNIGVSGILSATQIFYKKSGYLFVILVVMIAVIFSLLVRNQVEIITSFMMVIIIGCGSLAEYFLIGKYRVLLTADQKNYVISNMQAVATVLNTMVSVILIFQGINVLVVQAAATFIYISRVFVIQYYISKHYPQISFKAEPDFKALDKRWAAFIHQIAGIVVFNSPVVLITIFCGLKDASIYVVYSMIFGAVGLIVSVFSNGMLAGFGEIIAIKEQETLQRIYDNYQYIFYAVLAWAYTCTALLIMTFINIYAKYFTDANYIRPDIALLFIIIGVANNIRVPPNTIVNAAGHFQETQSRAILEASINLTVSLILVQFIGIVGVLIGSACSYAYRTIDFILYAGKYILKQSPSNSIKRIIINTVLAIISALPFVLWINIKATNYQEWFACAIGISVFVFVIIVAGNAVYDFRMFKSTLIMAKNLLSKGV